MGGQRQYELLSDVAVLPRLRRGPSYVLGTGTLARFGIASPAGCKRCHTRVVPRYCAFQPPIALVPGSRGGGYAVRHCGADGPELLPNDYLPTALGTVRLGGGPFDWFRHTRLPVYGALRWGLWVVRENRGRASSFGPF